MVVFLIALITVPFLIILIGQLPWPALDPGIAIAIQGVFTYIWSFNSVFPIDTVIRLALYGMTIEFALFTIRTTLWILSFFTKVGQFDDAVQKASTGKKTR